MVLFFPPHKCYHFIDENFIFNPLYDICPQPKELIQMCLVCLKISKSRKKHKTYEWTIYYVRWMLFNDKVYQLKKLKRYDFEFEKTSFGMGIFNKNFKRLYQNLWRKCKWNPCMIFIL